MPRGDLLLFMFVCSLAILFAELQVQREVSTRGICYALVWIVVVAMTIYLYSGS